MSTPPKRWSVRLTAAAQADFRQIVRWTADNLGARQARVYSRTLTLAVEALAGGPDVIGARRRDDIARGLCSLHVARGGRKGRHFVIFRVRIRGGSDVIEVLRLLHDAMELERHLPAS